MATLVLISGAFLAVVLKHEPDGIRGCFVAGRPLAAECMEAHPPLCPDRRGQPNGWPCLWVDPGTGEIFYVDSSAYWD